MNARFYDRLAAFASILLLVSLAAGTYYLAVWVARDGDANVVTTSNEPDVFVEGVSLIRVNANGDPVFRMSADSMQHFPIDGSSAFRRPLLVSLDTSRPTMSVRAKTAVASREGQSTVLEGEVVLTRAAEPDNPALTVHTERLVLTPDDESARTDLPVRIEHGTLLLQGTGMEFDNLSRKLSLNANVRANWTAPTANRQP